MPAPIAYVHLPTNVHYRRDAFIRGFRKIGFHVVEGQPVRELGPNDAAVIWNKTSRSRFTVEAARNGGGALLVAENGYFGEDQDRHQSYALALDGHNGSGRWFAPDSSRLEKLHINFKPFRQPTGRHLVIADQRGIGTKTMASPPGWGDKMQARLQGEGFEALLRAHPGPDKHRSIPLLDQLEGARCLVVWSSNCATQALIEGYPVYYNAPHIVTQGIAQRQKMNLASEPFTDENRIKAFSQMAWAQWFLKDIYSGEGLKYLIDVHQGRLPSCQKGMGV